jgi:hypothetical protein
MTTPPTPGEALAAALTEVHGDDPHIDALLAKLEGLDP